MQSCFSTHTNDYQNVMSVMKQKRDTVRYNLLDYGVCTGCMASFVKSVHAIFFLCWWLWYCMWAGPVRQQGCVVSHVHIWYLNVCSNYGHYVLFSFPSFWYTGIGSSWNKYVEVFNWRCTVGCSLAVLRAVEVTRIQQARRAPSSGSKQIFTGA